MPERVNDVSLTYSISVKLSPCDFNRDCEQLFRSSAIRVAGSARK